MYGGGHELAVTNRCADLTLICRSAGCLLEMPTDGGYLCSDPVSCCVSKQCLAFVCFANLRVCSVVVVFGYALLYTDYTLYFRHYLT